MNFLIQFSTSFGQASTSSACGLSDSTGLAFGWVLSGLEPLAGALGEV